MAYKKTYRDLSKGSLKLMYIKMYNSCLSGFLMEIKRYFINIFYSFQKSHPLFTCHYSGIHNILYHFLIIICFSLILSEKVMQTSVI